MLPGPFAKAVREPLPKYKPGYAPCSAAQGRSASPFAGGAMLEDCARRREDTGEGAMYGHALVSCMGTEPGGGEREHTAVTSASILCVCMSH